MKHANCNVADSPHGISDDTADLALKILPYFKKYLMFTTLENHSPKTESMHYTEEPLNVTKIYFTRRLVRITLHCVPSIMANATKKRVCNTRNHVSNDPNDRETLF